MILYNVTVKVNKDIAPAWLEWMQSTHIPDVMATGLFTRYQLCKILHAEPDGVTDAIQYFSPDMPSFERYNRLHAKALQRDHQEKFANQYVAFRTLMEVIE